jgi:hypothetical protein
MFLELLEKFVNDFSVGEYVGYIVGVILALVAFLNFIQNRIKEEKNEIIEKHLITKESIDEYIRNISGQLNHHPSLYKSLLSDVLNFLNKYLGELKLFSLKGFGTHYLISFLYSYFFFYLAWLLGGNGQIGILNFITNYQFNI